MPNRPEQTFRGKWYKGFNIEIDRGNSLYLYSIGLYDIKDGKVSIVLEKN